MIRHWYAQTAYFRAIVNEKAGSEAVMACLIGWGETGRVDVYETAVGNVVLEIVGCVLFEEIVGSGRVGGVLTVETVFAALINPEMFVGLAEGKEENEESVGIEYEEKRCSGALGKDLVDQR